MFFRFFGSCLPLGVLPAADFLFRGVLTSNSEIGSTSCFTSVFSGASDFCFSFDVLRRIDRSRLGVEARDDLGVLERLRDFGSYLRSTVCFACPLKSFESKMKLYNNLYSIFSWSIGP